MVTYFKFVSDKKKSVNNAQNLKNLLFLRKNSQDKEYQKEWKEKSMEMFYLH
jgi:hypothetical protein